MGLTHLPASAPAADVAAALAADGACIIDRVTEPAVLARALDELRPHLDATATGPDDFSGRNTRRTGGLVARSATCRDLVRHPAVLDVVRLVLGHATGFQLHLTQVIAVGPGEPAQPVHRDQWAFDFFPFPVGYEVQCNTIWAMTDFTEANGATRVVPGSHRLEGRPTFTQADTVPAEMEAGSVLLYTGSVFHGAGANASDEVRYGCNLTYCLSWLRQEENQYLTVPLEQVRTFDDDLVRLLGYARGAYALGYVDDLRDPIEVVRGPRPEARGFAPTGPA